jgi:hypothetical protein
MISEITKDLKRSIRKFRFRIFFGYGTRMISVKRKGERVI